MSDNPRIYYYCYRHNTPRGGQKHTYRHVDILNHNGFDAVAFHPGESDFRLSWFENDTRVISEAEFFSSVCPERDFLVLPETMGMHILEFPGRKVIFNKNIFLGFQAFGLDAVPIYPYQSPEVVGVFTVSEHNRRLLQFAFPRLVVDKVDVEIDEKVFQYRSLASKKPQIVCATKNPEILLPVYHMIRSRAAAGLNCGKQFEWIFLEQQTEVETATILGDSLLFLFFSVAEGLGRMPLEAMACGCISVAFSYGPLKCMVPQHEFEYADIVGLVQFVEKVMESYPRELEQWDLRISAGREIARRYSMKNQEVTVLKAWSRIYRHETI